MSRQLRLKLHHCSDSVWHQQVFPPLSWQHRVLHYSPDGACSFGLSSWQHWASTGLSCIILTLLLPSCIASMALGPFCITWTVLGPSCIASVALGPYCITSMVFLHWISGIMHPCTITGRATWLQVHTWGLCPTVSNDLGLPPPNTHTHMHTHSPIARLWTYDCHPVGLPYTQSKFNSKSYS